MKDAHAEAVKALVVCDGVACVGDVVGAAEGGIVVEQAAGTVVLADAGCVGGKAV